MEINLSKPDRWGFRWLRGFVGKSWGTQVGLVGISVVAGALLFGSWQMPFHSQAAISQSHGSTTSEDPPHFAKGGFSDIAHMVTPAVVNVTVTKHSAVPLSGTPWDSMKDFFDRPGMPGWPHRPHMPPWPQEQGAGSGIIVSPDGFVLTNNHVVDGAKDITVTLPDKREFSGKIIGRDPQTDLAVLKIDAMDLPFIKWGDSSKLQVGEYVLAVGNPFGLSSTVTLGIVSALGRGGMGITQYEDFIQTDAAINPGNSGGALVNTRGELVGINTAIFSRSGGYQGVGFAVPTNLAKPVYSGLVSTGKVVRGYLGVGIQAITPDLAQSFKLENNHGALVTNIMPGSPAAQAGIQRGDVIIDFQGKPVTDPRTLQGQVLETTIGQEVALGLIRDGQKKVVKPVIREHDAPDLLAQASLAGREGPLAGVAVQNLDERIVQQLEVEPEVHGVVVMEVAPGSYADRAGLIQGDVISEINRKPVRSEADFVKLVSHMDQQQAVLVFVHRGKGALYLTIKI